MNSKFKIAAWRKSIQETNNDFLTKRSVEQFFLQGTQREAESLTVREIQLRYI